MPQVDLSKATFEKLQSLAQPLVDTADTIVARLIEYYESHRVSGGGDSPGKMPTVSKDGERAQSGEFMSFEQFMEPILEVLRQAGGELPAGEAIDAVGELVGHQFNDVDRAPVSSGEVRWRNNVRWARNELKKAGKLDPDAPHGIWRLA